ncbi:forespore capture DNA-binding protein RefZ [Thalassobacillus sp. CUG 92003]|uniref:forespore capture DNA-binding protein RefZ n=1 Tax=Thalassobacillus sp. CUG 92003 TaxID=2736641 RepID=UPI0015E72968
MNKNKTREKVLDVACQLFYTKGFHGTSVRDISGRAHVNVSLINYYFTSKQGLFESLAVDYYEPYLEMLENHLWENNVSTWENFSQLVKRILHYKQDRYQLSCLIHRELSLDSMFAREMLVTYMAKENHLIYGLFKAISSPGSSQEISLQYLQFKGMLNAPYMMPHEFRQTISSDHSRRHFAEVYSKTLLKWLENEVMPKV